MRQGKAELRASQYYSRWSQATFIKTCSSVSSPIQCWSQAVVCISILPRMYNNKSVCDNAHHLSPWSNEKMLLWGYFQSGGGKFNFYLGFLIIALLRGLWGSTQNFIESKKIIFKQLLCQYENIKHPWLSDLQCTAVRSCGRQRYSLSEYIVKARGWKKIFYSIFKLGTLRIWIPLHGKWKLLRELRDPIGSHVNQLPFCTGHNGDIAVYSFFIQISGTKFILSQRNLKLDWIIASSFQSI